MALKTGAVNLASAGGLTAFASARIATQQSANIAANDHLKFDTVDAVEGTEIIPDTTTAYVTTQGAASVGRFLLHGSPNAGLTYRLQFNAGYVLFSGATGLLELQFYDATNGAVIPGGTVSIVAATDAGHDGGSSSMEAVFTPLSDVLVEVRILVATALTRIGTTASRFPTVFISLL